MEDEGGSDSVKIESSLISTEDEDDDWTDVRCEPVIDFLHAQVFTQDNNDNLQVYGKINLIDIQGSNIFPVYELDRYEFPQRLYSANNFLQLSGPQEIPTLNDPLLYVDIKNVDTDDVIAHGEQTLLKTTQLPDTDHVIEQLSTLKFEASTSHVELQCAAFTFGVYAQVKTFLYKDSDQNIDEENGVELFGLIYAQCNPLHVPKDKYKNHMFNVVKQNHEWVGYGGEIVLFKDLVAVPAYSQLEISLDLWVSDDAGFEDDGFSVQGSVCFRPTNSYGGREDVPGGNGYFVRVHVLWKEPSLLNKYYCSEDIIDGFRSLYFSIASKDIIASCSELLYSTIYDKQFFRRVLFSMKEANSLGGQGDIELSSNYVAVPMTSSLLAEVNMYFQIAGGTHHVEKIVEFQIGRPQMQRIASDVGNICFDVEWKVFPYYRSPDWQTSCTIDC